MFEYKVVPAPQRGLKGRGIKGTPARFANALQTLMNKMAAEGWEYQRADTLPVEERQGLTGKTTTFQNMLVFRKAIVADATFEDAETAAALIEDKSVEPTEPQDADTPDDVATQDQTNETLEHEATDKVSLEDMTPSAPTDETSKPS